MKTALDSIIKVLLGIELDTMYGTSIMKKNVTIWNSIITRFLQGQSRCPKEALQYKFMVKKWLALKISPNSRLEILKCKKLIGQLSLFVVGQFSLLAKYI